MNSLLSLQPDAYTRFYTMRTIIEGLVNDASKVYTILDIGGSSTYLSRFLAQSDYKFKITVIDPLPRPEKLPKSIDYIQASGEDIPKLEQKFDFCIMIDMLEHLPSEELKTTILTNASQAAKTAVIVAGPFDADGTDLYEHKLNDLNKEFFGVDQSWLAEHFEYGKPNLK
jgi:Methyltransferase domain